MSMAKRKFFGEIAALLDKMVMVVTMDGKKYSGTFGNDQGSLTVTGEKLD